MTTTHFIQRTKGYDRSARTIEDAYRVRVDAPNDTDAAIAAVEARPVPAGYLVDNVRAAHINRNPLWFDVRITYKQPLTLGGTGADDPLTRPSTLSASYDEWTEPYDTDHTPAPDGPKPVVNSAGDPFQSFPERKAGTLVLQVTKNVATFDAVAYDAIKFTTNASAVTIRGTVYPKDTLLFLPPTVQEVYEQIGSQTYHYFTVTYRLAADANRHRHPIADRGYREQVNGEMLPILDGEKRPTEEPWPLDGSGRAKPAGSAPATLTFQPYASAAWGIDFS